MSDVLNVARDLLDARRVDEDADQLTQDFRAFIPHAWQVLKPDEPFKSNWHIDAIAELLTAVTEKELTRAQVWVPPASMKTMLVSVFWPAWEWTHHPGLRYWTASYVEDLSKEIASWSRNLITSDWYQARWGHRFNMLRTSDVKFSNDRGGSRLATSPEGKGTGLHGHRIIIDDPIKPDDAEATSRVMLGRVNDWYDRTVATRGIGDDHARVIVMQRLHENDLAGHVLEDEYWEVLCLPEQYESKHPYAWAKDPRSDGELLWPEWRGAEASRVMTARMRSHRAAGQMQQRPAAAEGEILKRHWWRFYNPRLFTDPALHDRRPRFNTVVQSVDCPQKDKQSNDQVAIQAWAALRADRYLLDQRLDRMNYNQAKRAILEQARYVRSLYPQAAHHLLIETGGYGYDLGTELKREITGVHILNSAKEGDKELRAEAAAADLETGNCYLPGYRMGRDEMSMPDEARSPADTVRFIDNCARFPNAAHDDDVDAWSQAMNWLRNRPAGRARAWSSFKAGRR